MVRWFRVHMLRRWKRNVFQSYVENLYHTFPDVAPAVSATFDSMVASESLSTEPSNHFPVLPTYLWRTGRLGGRIKYCRWWLQQWSKAAPEFLLGLDVIARASKSSWWSWEDGSRPIHWRWPAKYMVTIRDGLPVHFLHQMAPY
jgi:hypothetical protein